MDLGCLLPGRARDHYLVDGSSYRVRSATLKGRVVVVLGSRGRNPVEPRAESYSSFSATLSRD
jgi:hypothetical protein